MLSNESTQFVRREILFESFLFYLWTWG